MNITIIVEIKNVYGTEKIYPACERSEIFAKMLGQKTLTRSDISYIKQLGYKVENFVQLERL